MRHAGTRKEEPRKEHGRTITKHLSIWHMVFAGTGETSVICQWHWDVVWPALLPWLEKLLWLETRKCFAAFVVIRASHAYDRYSTR